MREFRKNLLLGLVTFLVPILIASSVFAGIFFSEGNFKKLKDDPRVLFSKDNVCQLKSILGEKEYNLFKESMSLMTTEDEDLPDYVSITGNVKGLFTIFEGFFRLSKNGKVWIAYLFDNQVHYFTNDESTLKNPPHIMLKWSSRFKEAKWVYNLIKLHPTNCK